MSILKSPRTQGTFYNSHRVLYINIYITIVILYIDSCVSNRGPEKLQPLPQFLPCSAPLQPATQHPIIQTLCSRAQLAALEPATVPSNVDPDILPLNCQQSRFFRAIRISTLRRLRCNLHCLVHFKSPISLMDVVTLKHTREFWDVTGWILKPRIGFWHVRLSTYIVHPRIASRAYVSLCSFQVEPDSLGLPDVVPG